VEEIGTLHDGSRFFLLSMQEVRLPAQSVDSVDRSPSVRLATRNELQRAHTMPEAQVHTSRIAAAAAAAAGCILVMFYGVEDAVT